MSNWTSGTDRFYATAVTDTPARDTPNVAPLNQITFGTISPTLTQWKSVTNEILVTSTSTYWDGPASDNTTVGGGTGTWNAGNLNWTLIGGTPNSFWAQGNSIARFAGTAGTVTVSGT